jgi:sarcosine oxidase subunit beta
MTRTADVVIIGAGVMGASVAWHLGRLGVRSVLLLEREVAAGQGSTGRATGGFRAQFASTMNVRLSLLSRRLLLRFAQDTGGDAGYQPVGYLFLASSEAELAILRDAAKVQQQAGLSGTRVLSVREALALAPAVSPEGIVGGTFGPHDGYIRPLGLLQGYLDGAMRAGATLATSAEPVAIECRGNRVLSVRLPDGERIAAGHVVNAAGPWAALVAALASVALPVAPLRRQVGTTALTDALPPTTPLTIFTSDGFHFRVRDRRVLLLWPTDTRGSGPHDTTFDPAWLDGVVSRTQARVPALRNVPIDPETSWCGLYEMSPDHHALLGRAPGFENFWCINGSSGHGVMHAPALGLLLAEQIVHGAARTLDASALDPGRFAAGRPNPSPVLL